MMKLLTLLALASSASGLMVRDKAPDFKAQAVIGEEFEEVSLSQYTEVLCGWWRSRTRSSARKHKTHLKQQSHHHHEYSHD